MALLPGMLGAVFASPAQTIPWHLDGWQARAVVQIAEGTPGADTAAVKILCQGKVKPDGSDYRVLDGVGNPVPFQLMYHDPERYSLISFRADDPQQSFHVYFGNAEASLAPEQIILNATPGAGPPTSSWIPRQGLVLATIERPEGENPETPEQMAALIAASPARFGARYQQRIADGFNPFGPSDMYISIYRGWINLPESGKYTFCTASNEASFSFLDGHELVHWPGRHTVERGVHGEKHVEIELTAGLHYAEYYHEDVYLQQMAFLGWRTPAREGEGYDNIPASAFPRPHQAKVVAYESKSGPLICFEPVVADSIWPKVRHEGQYTRCVFQAPALPQDATAQWDFGDGQAGSGIDVEHVYLTLDRYPVSLTVTNPQGTFTGQWPLRIYEIQQVTDEGPEGVPANYLNLAKTYDRTKLNPENLKELAHLLFENGALPDAAAAGKEFIERFPDTNLRWVADIRRLLAACALRQGDAGVEEAISNYQESLAVEQSAVLKLDAYAQLIQIVGVERGLVDESERLLGQADAVIQTAVDDEAIDAYRRVVATAGDTRLWNGRADSALELYQKAEALDANPIPPQVRAARTGAYPDTIRQFIADGKLSDAANTIDEWEQNFPTEKRTGKTFFWRGKLLALLGQHQQAVRYLALCVKLAAGAGFETEARWLLAQSLERLDRGDEARRELASLIAIGMKDDFTRQARDRLQAIGASEGAAK